LITLVVEQCVGADRGCTDLQLDQVAEDAPRWPDVSNSIAPLA
jgi:hypothetical protein